MLLDKIYNLKVRPCSCTHFLMASCLSISSYISSVSEINVMVQCLWTYWCVLDAVIECVLFFFPLVFIASKRHLTILSFHRGDAIELNVTFYLMYKLKNKKEKEKKNSVIEDGNSSCSSCDQPWLLFTVYRMSRLWWGRNAVSLVLPDNWSCFVLIELPFFSVAEIAASGSIGF